MQDSCMHGKNSTMTSSSPEASVTVCMVLVAEEGPVTPLEAAGAPALPLNLMLLSRTQSGSILAAASSKINHQQPFQTCITQNLRHCFDTFTALQTGQLIIFSNDCWQYVPVKLHQLVSFSQNRWTPYSSHWSAEHYRKVKDGSQAMEASRAAWRL